MKPWAAAAVAALLLVFMGGAAWAGGHRRYEPLTQHDIEAYVFLVPRLAGNVKNDPRRAARLLAQAGVTKGRLAYVTAKIAIAQAMTTGALSAERAEKEVPPYLRPDVGEVALVGRHLHALKLAQETARREAGAAE